MDTETCEICKKLKALKDQYPDCENCMPKVDKGNEIALKIFLKVRGQHIMGFNGPVDLNHLSVFKWMDIYQVPPNDREELFGRVNSAYHAALAALRDKNSDD